MWRSFSASPIFAHWHFEHAPLWGVVCLVVLLAGCVGRTTVASDEDIKPGQALGFDFIHYVSTSLLPGDELFQEVLDIEADGRMPFQSGLVTEPPRTAPFVTCATRSSSPYASPSPSPASSTTRTPFTATRNSNRTSSPSSTRWTA